MPPHVPRKRAVSPDEKTDSQPPKKKIDLKRVTRSQRKTSLLDDHDAGLNSRKTQPSKAILDNLTACEYNEESSRVSSPLEEFEDVVSIAQKCATNETSSEEDESIKFEDVRTSITTHLPPARQSGDLELTLTRDTRISVINPLGSKKAPTKIERQIRISTHKCHVQSLMWHNAIRNSWLCDKELQEILTQQLPQKIKQMIEKWKRNSALDNEKLRNEDREGRTRSSRNKKADVQNQRDWGQTTTQSTGLQVDMSAGDPLFQLLRVLVQYWRGKFKITAPGLRKIGYMSLQKLDIILKCYNRGESDLMMHGESFRNLDEFRQRAKILQGSRDFGAQLFTALLRAIGLKARMIASLQPLGFGWNRSEEATEINTAKSRVPSKVDNYESDSTSQKVSAEKKSINRSKKKSSAGKVSRISRIQKSNRSGCSNLSANLKEGSDSDLSSPPSDDESFTRSNYFPTNFQQFDKDLKYPHYWSEVLSPVTNTYTPVDATVLHIIATNRELTEKFEPRCSKADRENQVIAYVIGHSSDGTAKDLTTRYLKGRLWPGKTKSYRYPLEKVTVWNPDNSTRHDLRRDWFKTLMYNYERGSEKYPRDGADYLEEETDLKPIKREKKDINSKKETLQYYKTSPEFILERHMKREEALRPTAEHIKFFTVGKGDNAVQEKVFLRKDVITCKSVESWHKEGRAPRPGEEPSKHVPYRVATNLRKRKLAEAEHALGEKLLQGLYSFEQTELIIPAPIENGIIPKNEYGNVDLFVDTMLPKGAIHLVERGIPKVCRRLNIDFAGAVTGFEFGNRMAVPIITGVLVAEEYFDIIMEEWHKDEARRVQLEEEKKRKAALKMWKKLLICQRVIKRCYKEYGKINDNEDTSSRRLKSKSTNYSPGSSNIKQDNDDNENYKNQQSTEISSDEETDRSL